MQSLPRGDFDTKPLCHLPGSGEAAGWPGHGRHRRHGRLLQETDGGEEQEVRYEAVCFIWVCTQQRQTGWLD